MMVRKALFLCFALLLVTWIGTPFTKPVAASTQASFYVSPSGSDTNPGTESQPFQTIEKAKAAVEAVDGNMTGDIVVYLRGGTYQLNSTLTFGAADSATNGHRIIYRNYPGEAPIISGGASITGWTDLGNGMVSASVNSGFAFRNLYVNDTRAVRARTPNVGSYYTTINWDMTNQFIQINQSEIASWNHLNQVEMVLSRSFVQNRVRIGSFTTDSTNSAYADVTPMSPDREDAFDSKASFADPQDSSYYFENAYEFLDQPGEWYLDTSTNKVYYMLKPGETASNIQVSAPKLEEVIDLNGATNLTFYGLDIQQSNYLRPDNEGYIERQGGLYSKLGIHSLPAPAGVLVTHSAGIRFERDIFRHMGANGVDVEEATYDLSFVGNVFTDISDTGILYDSANEKYPANGYQNTRATIANNYFYGMGAEYYAGSAIFCLFPDKIKIIHNEIDHTGGIGINTSYGAEYGDTVLQYPDVRYNEVQHAALTAVDSAGIHTKSYVRDGWLFENYVHDILRGTVFQHYGTASVVRRVNGFYLDDASSNFTVENNVISNVSDDPLFIRTTGLATQNITQVNNTSADSRIISNAGLQSDYADIVNDVNGGDIGGTGNPTDLFQTVFWDDFDTDATDSSPSHYTVSVTGGTVKVKETQSATEKAAELSDTDSTTTGVSMARTFNAKSGKLNAEARIMPDQTTGAIFFKIMSGSTVAAQVALAADGNRKYFDNTGSHDIGSYTGNNWYLWRMEIDTTTDKYDVWVNDEKIVTQASLQNAVSSVDKIYIAATTGTGVYDVDHVQVESNQIDTSDWNINPTDLMNEDFEDNTANNWTIQSGTWSVVTDTSSPDASQTYEAQSASDETALLSGSNSWKNTTLTMDVKPVTIATNSKIVVDLRENGTEDSRYRLGLKYDASGNPVLFASKQLNGTWSSLGSPQILSISTSHWYSMNVVAYDSTLIVGIADYSDSTNAASLKLSDSDLASGSLSIHAENTTVRFDDVEVK